MKLVVQQAKNLQAAIPCPYAILMLFSGGGAGGGKQQYVTRITGCAREDEMDDNLGAVSNILGDLKNMAQDMGEEINKQNKQADRIKGKVSEISTLLLQSLLKRCQLQAHNQGLPQF